MTKNEKGRDIMQAYEGYLEDGQFYPTVTQTALKGRRRVIMTVLDEERGDEKRGAEVRLFAELARAEKTELEKGLLSEEEADAMLASL
jgi:hypothetical protein